LATLSLKNIWIESSLSKSQLLFPISLLKLKQTPTMVEPVDLVVAMTAPVVQLVMGLVGKDVPTRRLYVVSLLTSATMREPL
jgi:hypothetical protein